MIFRHLCLIRNYHYLYLNGRKVHQKQTILPMIAKVRQAMKVPRTYVSDAPQHIINCINRGIVFLR
jgi:ABC-type molybdate transport system ATPase subunit